VGEFGLDVGFLDWKQAAVAVWVCAIPIFETPHIQVSTSKILTSKAYIYIQYLYPYTCVDHYNDREWNLR
jgi:hypothetical protein